MAARVVVDFAGLETLVVFPFVLEAGLGFFEDCSRLAGARMVFFFFTLTIS